MDNLTHTLIGLVAGEILARGTAARANGLTDSTRRTTLLTMGMVGGNLPDVDLLWSMEFFTGDRVAYLVEHRGHTHTLLGCAVLAVILFLGALAILAWRRRTVSASDAGLLGFMALLSVLLHLGMDALNEYGVHPFWPINNRWYYGDTLFIVEPLFWLATAPMLLSLRSRSARVILGAVLFIGCLAVLAFHGFGGMWWPLPILTILLILGGRRLTPRAAATVTGMLMVAVIAVFSIARMTVSQRVAAVAAAQFPGIKTLDIVLSPAPAHPFCWDVMLLQREQNDYFARRGQLSLIWGASGVCGRILGEQGTAPLQPMLMPIISGMRWMQSFSMDVSQLARLAATDCNTRRAASFLRAPFAVQVDKGWIIGDLRYDREPGPGFAEVAFDPEVHVDCVTSIPWTPPRRDLGF